MSLDKLRELDKAASPGPWTADQRLLIENDVERGMVRIMARFDEHKEAAANAQLTALSHHLLPMAEALEPILNLDIRHGKCARPMITSPCVCGAEAAVDTARAVLVQLEEALK